MEEFSGKFNSLRENVFLVEYLVRWFMVCNTRIVRINRIILGHVSRRRNSYCGWNRIRFIPKFLPKCYKSIYEMVPKLIQKFLNFFSKFLQNFARTLRRTVTLSFFLKGEGRLRFPKYSKTWLQCDLKDQD